MASSWFTAALVVTGSWLLGAIMWWPDDTAGFGRIPFGWFDVVPYLALGVVPAIPGAFLTRAHRRSLQVSGTVLVVLATLAMAFVAFWESFGGVCLDPGEDVCVVTRTEHVTHLLLPLSILAVGWAIARRPRQQQ